MNLRNIGYDCGAADATLLSAYHKDLMRRPGQQWAKIDHSGSDGADNCRLQRR